MAELKLPFRSIITAIAFVINFVSPTEAQELCLNGGHENYKKQRSVVNPNDSCFRELFQKDAIPPVLNPPNPPGIASASYGTPDHLCTSPHGGSAHGGYFHIGKLENPIYQLCNPLIAGKQYVVSFWIRLQEKNYYAADQIGVFLTTWDYYAKSAGIAENPQFTTPKGVYFDNETAYRKVSFMYRATGGETGVVLGNFTGTSNPSGSTYKVANAGSGSKTAYYYVDDISVKPVMSILGDTAVCSGSEARVWIDNLIGCSKDVAWFLKTDPGKVISKADTLTLTVSNTTELMAKVGSDTLFFTIRTDGKSQDLLGPDQGLCPNEQLVLQPKVAANATFRWQDGTTLPTYTVSQPGWYAVTVSQNNCTSSDSIRIFQLPPTPDITLSAEQYLCPGDSIVIRLNDIAPLGYTWQDGSTGDRYVIYKTGNYQVSIQSKCGSKSLPFTIKSPESEVEKLMLFPNAFSPDGDRINDEFKPVVNGKILQYELRIINRWGTEVFRSNDPQMAWDGTKDGSPLPQEVYIWHSDVVYDACGTPKPVKLKGAVMMVR